ncbi:hypothetical protein FOQG_14961 [Fusarium oxysporum f. sp. raphani 54005]|uniref:Zn(2)-C6 fungal-type domain-containing protein n=2 Tax=Fusarium oxysporum f. sp. raphani TaxID=96318 RepID=X0BFD3_FUSOX|nr:hypothetical protein FOQG_14961 [Fusarium oxysporum f. sp. raphani 54005]
MVSSRQRSCSACVRGKRRCDLGFPQCGRCLSRRVTCVYAWMSPEDAQEVAESSEVIVWNDQTDSTGTSHSDHASSPPEVLPGNCDVSFFPTPITLPPPLVPLIEEITGQGRTISLFTPDPYPQSTNQSYPNTDLNAQTLYPATTIGTSLVPSRGPKTSSVYTGNAFKERAEYAASRLVHQVKSFAESGQTSFIHYSQVSSSTALRDAFAACSLYTTRNSVNASLVASEVAQRAELLIKATDTAIALSPPNPYSVMNLDLLPSIQAILIYQSMRLFSDDSSQKIQAEQNAKSLARWVDMLRAQTADASSILSKSGHGWKDWVRAESVQRTMVFADLLDSIYTFLEFGWYQPSSKIAKLSFAGQEAIWNARSMTEWHEARKQKAWLRMEMSRFRDSIKGASLNQIEELGIIILVSYEGVEVLREWAGDDKSLLEKWGLRSGADMFSWPN